MSNARVTSTGLSSLGVVKTGDLNGGASSPDGRLRVALIPSCNVFEAFYEQGLGLTRKQYLSDYRNDFITDYCLGLKSRGVDVTVYMPTTGPSEHTVADDGFTVRFLGLGPAGRALQRMKPLGRGRIGRYVIDYPLTRTLVVSIRKAIAEDRIDVLYAQEYWIPRFDAITKVGRVPLVAGDQGGRRNVNLDWFKKTTLRKATQIYCLTSERTKELSAFGAHAECLANGVDTDAFRPADQQVSAHSSPTVLCVARFNDAQKRLSDLIRSFQYLPNEYKLRIVGRGPDESLLRQVVEDENLTSRVEFLGFRRRDEVVKLLQEIPVFALVSAWEGLPLAVIEAMACGSSVVVSDISAFSDLCRDAKAATVVPQGDLHAIAEGIQRAYTHRASIGPAARQVVLREFSSDVVFDRLAHLLLAAARNSQARGRL